MILPISADPSQLPVYIYVLKSCVHLCVNIYVLTSIIRNRKLKSESTYASFVDMKKAYDYLARDSLV